MDASVVIKTIVWWGFGLGIVFGFIANKTNFCTMGAISDVVNMVFNPAAGMIAGKLGENELIYYCVDEYTAFTGSSALKEIEENLFRMSDLVVVSAEKLYNDGAKFADAWNFGPADEDAKPVQWIVEKLTLLWGDGAAWHLASGHHPHEAHYLKLDCSKARATLGWSPRWHLGQALHSIIAWHKAQHRGQDMRAICLQQINDYFNVSHANPEISRPMAVTST